jgi:zinc D-Ala-D-Ala carboxypeptidase
MGTGDDLRRTALVMPAGVAAAQARIASIESRFVAPSRAASAPAADFESLLATARAEAAPPLPASATRATTDVGALGLGSSGGACCAHGGELGHVHSTEMGAAGPPPELAAYGNGRIPAHALSPIGQGQHRLWAPAAASFERMSAAAAREGVTIRVTDSYRSYDSQVDLARRKGIYGQGGLAARPGTSNHGWGRSLDIDTSGGAADWLRANAPRFGFHEDVPGEPWHWTYRPA